MGLQHHRCRDIPTGTRLVHARGVRLCARREGSRGQSRQVSFSVTSIRDILELTSACSFFFPKDDVKSMEMVEAHLPPSFHAVSRVEFNVIATKPILYLDNVKYKTYNVTSIGRGLREVINSGASSQSEFHIQVTSGGHEGAVMF